MRTIQKNEYIVLFVLAFVLPTASGIDSVIKADDAIMVGVAVVDITPPDDFPMAGYYHERLSDGMLDPLLAKAIVFRTKETSAAIVVCDLIGISTDLSNAIRKQASAKTGIPGSNIVVSATHSHTAPDYMKELWLNMNGVRQSPSRAKYVQKLITGPVSAISKAFDSAKPSTLSTGYATQKTPVAFNRRFVMRDGSVKTWARLSDPKVVRAAGPIDPEIGLLMIKDAKTKKPTTVVSNFALHLDTVGGTKWSADYPTFISETIKAKTKSDLVSLFTTGCCGDINHVNPATPERNKADFIGRSIGETISSQLEKLSSVDSTQLIVDSKTADLPLEEVTKVEIEQAIKTVSAAQKKEKVDFFEHVTARKKLMLDQLRHKKPIATTREFLKWGLSKTLTGIGEKLPVKVTTITLGHDVAIVCLPGEVFVDLGLAIKRGSPFRTTIIIELSDAVETFYVPHRAAYAGGSYEVTNSALKPGGGEILVETALRSLRESASRLVSIEKK